MVTIFSKLTLFLCFFLFIDSFAKAHPTAYFTDSIKAVNDIISTRKNTGITFQPVQNDYLVGTFLGISIIEPSRRGSIAYPTANSLYYLPEGGFCGKDTIRYRVCTTTKCDSAYIYIGVSCEAGFLSFPIANNDFITIAKNALFTFNPLENDQLDGSVLGTGIVKEPKFGSATFRPNELIYIPRPESCGKDTMSYRVCNDKYQCDTASVFFNISCDALPNPLPVVVTYRMRLDAPSPSGDVYVTGDFQKDGKHGANWDPSVIVMKKPDATGFYTFSDTVLNKIYQFKFLKGNTWIDPTNSTILVETARFDKLNCGTANNFGIANRVIDLTNIKIAFSQVTVTYDWNKCTPGLAVPSVVSTTSAPLIGGRTIGGGSYFTGDTVIVKAIPYSEYRFFYWADNNIIVSQDSVYRFSMGNNSRSLTAVFSKITSTQDILESQLAVYPNPTTGIIEMAYSHESLFKLTEWCIMDALGRKILRGYKKEDMNLARFNDGIYVLHITTDKGQLTKRIVLKR
jgi:hypothetical protein